MDEMYRHLSIEANRHETSEDRPKWTVSDGILTFSRSNAKSSAKKRDEGKTATQTLAVISQPKRR